MSKRFLALNILIAATIASPPIWAHHHHHFHMPKISRHKISHGLQKIEKAIDDAIPNWAKVDKDDVAKAAVNVARVYAAGVTVGLSEIARKEQLDKLSAEQRAKTEAAMKQFEAEVLKGLVVDTQLQAALYQQENDRLAALIGGYQDSATTYNLLLGLIKYEMKDRILRGDSPSTLARWIQLDFSVENLKSEIEEMSSFSTDENLTDEQKAFQKKYIRLVQASQDHDDAFRESIYKILQTTSDDDLDEIADTVQAAKDKSFDILSKLKVQKEESDIKLETQKQLLSDYQQGGLT